ncbi:MAG TPA: hypothetical protein VMH24_05340, partial [Candidatus Sulfotelmatobacter sp.]|nr:hypothetical protein [Candidatus Sulfotelmatobacter sp.]
MSLAAIVAVVAIIALAFRFTITPTPVTPGGSPTPNATASPSGSPAPSGSAAPTAVPSPTAATATVPPLSTTAWTGLTASAIAAPAPATPTIVRWSGGYFAIGGETADGPQRAWLSRDGRAWTELPASTFGLDDPTGNTLFNAAAGCGDRLLVEIDVTTPSGTGTVSLWSSSDGTTWTQAAFHNDSRGTLVARGSVAVADTETGGAAANGTALLVSTDCATWQRVSLPGPAVAQITDLGVNANGFVAVGWSGDQASTTAKPLAWYSSDGQQWSAATIKSAQTDEGFFQVSAGANGFIALTTNPGLTPGTSRLWASSDGRSWAPTSADPLGTVQSGEGVGALAGSFTGDGTRLLAYGQPGTSPANDTAAGQAEYFISADGVHWTQLAISGPAATAVLADQYPVPILMLDGVLFSSGSAAGDWFGT